jgi:hypothetical protein
MIRFESLPNLLKMAKSHMDEVDLGGDDIYQICKLVKTVKCCYESLPVFVSLYSF